MYYDEFEENENMTDYDSEEYFTHGTETVDAIDKILRDDNIKWSDWVQGTQGFVYCDPDDDTKSVLFSVEKIIERVENKVYEEPEILNRLTEEELEALKDWLDDHGFDLEEVW